MTYYLTVDVGSFKHHVFMINDPVRATNAFNLLHGAIAVGSNPIPTTVIVPLNEGELASFRRTDLCAVSLVEGRP